MVRGGVAIKFRALTRSLDMQRVQQPKSSKFGKSGDWIRIRHNEMTINWNWGMRKGMKLSEAALRAARGGLNQ